MGTSLTTRRQLIKPDDVESINVDHLNTNWDKVDAMPLTLVGNLPEGKIGKTWTGFVESITGSSGENREAAGATDAAGYGGIWLGYGGIPKFEGISAVHLTSMYMLQDRACEFAVLEANTTRIKYRAKRQDPALSGQTWANAYGSIGIAVTISGW